MGAARCRRARALGALLLACAAARTRATDLECAASALTGLHLVVDQGGDPVRARIQCEGAWSAWEAVGDASAARAEHEVGARCDRGQGVVALSWFDSPEEPFAVQCASPRRTHTRFARRAERSCARGELAYGVRIAPDERSGGEFAAGPTLLCRSTWLIPTDGDVSLALDLLGSTLAERARGAVERVAVLAERAVQSPQLEAAREGVRDAGYWLNDHTGPLPTLLAPLTRALQLALAVATRALGTVLAAARRALPPVMAALGRALGALAAFVARHRDLYVRVYTTLLRTGRRLTLAVATLSRRVTGAIAARVGGAMRSDGAPARRARSRGARGADGGEDEEEEEEEGAGDGLGAFGFDAGGAPGGYEEPMLADAYRQHAAAADSGEMGGRRVYM